MVRRVELGTNAKATEVDQIYRIFSEVGLSKRSEKRREEASFLLFVCWLGEKNLDKKFDQI